jgi:hypothetical protein
MAAVGCAGLKSCGRLHVSGALPDALNVFPADPVDFLSDLL